MISYYLNAFTSVRMSPTSRIAHPTTVCTTAGSQLNTGMLRNVPLMNNPPAIV